MKINADILLSGGSIPQKEFESSGGYDVSSSIDITIPSGGSVVPLGFHISLPHGVGMFPFSRSGIAVKGIPGYNTEEDYKSDSIPVRHRCFVMLGLVDSGYNGECGLLVYNTGDPFFVPAGTSMGQVVFINLLDVDFHIVNHLNPTDRGTQGFNS